MKIHCCALDRTCWEDWRKYGRPMRLHVGNRFWTFPLLSGSVRDYDIQRIFNCPRGKHNYREIYYPKKGRHFEACSGCMRIGKIWRWEVPDDGEPQASSITKRLIELERAKEAKSSP